MIRYFLKNQPKGGLVIYFDDQRKLYQPALLPRQIHALYLLKCASGKPMTYHARVAVDRYLADVADPEILEAAELDDG